KVVMQALAVVGTQIGLARGLVMPGTIRGARLHDGENPDQTGMLAALLQHLVNFVLLAKSLGTADEVDLQEVLGRQTLGIGAQRLAPGLRCASTRACSSRSTLFRCK